MKYAEVRDGIKSGDVLAWSEGGWSNWHDIQVNLVRIATRSEYSHVGVAVWMGSRLFVVEAVVPMVRIFPLSKLLPFYLIRTPWQLDKAGEDLLFERVGKPYSKWEAIKAFFTTDTNGEHVWECAKLVNRTLMRYDEGFDKLNDTPTATVKYLQYAHNAAVLAVEA